MDYRHHIDNDSNNETRVYSYGIEENLNPEPPGAPEQVSANFIKESSDYVENFVYNANIDYSAYGFGHFVNCDIEFYVPETSYQGSGDYVEDYSEHY